MQTVEQIAREIVAREGGFVKDLADPGGATKYGVTIGTLRRLGIDTTGDGQVHEEDVKNLTRAQAEAIFIEHYYRRPGIGNLPEPIQPGLFDMYVNAGNNAVKILQRLLTDMGFPSTADGLIGPLTIRAAQAAWEAAPGYLCDAYSIARRNWYYALADGRPASRKFACRKDGGKGGWIVRAELFMDKRYRLTDEQHKARVSSWG